MKLKVNFEIDESEVKEILKHILYFQLLSPEVLRGITELLKVIAEGVKVFF